MSSITITWEYLTGYAVATDPTTRDRVEWPPHPARVFMALAAAWFETRPVSDSDENAMWAEEEAALRWLESLGDPEMILPVSDRFSERASVTVHVPVNDAAGPAKAALQSCPTISRSKQPRTFPRMYVGHDPIRMRWRDLATAGQHLEALDRLCRKVTRIGHSSSLVSMRATIEEEPIPAATLTPVAENSRLLAALHARSFTSGTLDMLTERFGEAPRQAHAELGEEIESLQAERRAVRGKGAREAKATIDARIGELQARRAEIVVRPPVRPSMGIWTGYAPGQPTPQPEPERCFDNDILVLAQVDGPRLPLPAALAVTQALRKTIMKGDPQPTPGWVSGHQPDGKPSQESGGHLAIVPLPFVGHKHADGHLLGVGLVFPRSIPPRERGRVLGRLLVKPDRKPKRIELEPWLGRFGVCGFQKREWDEPRSALRPESWTAATFGQGNRPGSRFWASVTPVVLDRFPKANHLDPDQRQSWEEEVIATVRAGCVRIGLPEPQLIDIGTTSWHLGCPRAVAKRRPLRGHPDASHKDAQLGDSFPPYPARGSNAPRPQVHVWLQFPEPVIGPVLIGAGRYLGYGFCKPWEVRQP